MTTKTLLIDSTRVETVFTVFKRDPVLASSVILALASCLAAQPRVDYIDFKVLACLFNIMIVVKAYEELHLLERMSVHILNGCKDSQHVSLVLILLCFFSSMLFTNDIALLTFVPLTMVIGRKSGLDMMPSVILQTLAANIGSSLTPMGNPQNLYIFSFYELHAWQFFTTVGAFAGVGFLWLLLLNKKSTNTKLKFSLDVILIKDFKLVAIWGFVFVIIILSVFGLVNYAVAFLITVLAAFIINRRLLVKADYPLLITFICFFIFIGNISHITVIQTWMRGLLDSGNSTFFGSILMSQIISNVPSAILLSGFTSHWKELLLGVDIGGMGTIIASLASLISYKLYIGEMPEHSGKYIWKFSLYNFSGLALFTLLNFVFLRI